MSGAASVGTAPNLAAIKSVLLQATEEVYYFSDDL